MLVQRLTLVAALVAAGCSASGGSGSSPGAAPPVVPTATPSNQKIAHVIIVIQENRSFDDFFATFPGADGTTYGYTHAGKRINLVSGPLVTRDLPHSHVTFVNEYADGNMNGFDTIRFSSGGMAKTYPYRYVNPADIAPYWTMARQYVLADHMFQTQGSGSFTAHQDLIAGSTAINAYESLVDFPSKAPWGCDAPEYTVTSLLTKNRGYLHGEGPFPCLRYPTLRDLLDGAKLSWKYYVPPFRPGSYGQIWNAFDAIHAVRYSSEWQDNISSPETNILSDIKARKLPAVAWVVPSARNSDHPGGNSTSGPAWVASIVNAVGTSPYWQSSAIVILWDDWGGLYDHVPPPQIDYQGLGFRVPCLIVSPYARHGYVTHTQYEFASILKFVEDNWALGRINGNDQRANSIAGAFDFTQSPRGFIPIPAALDESYFMRQPPSDEPVDTQ